MLQPPLDPDVADEAPTSPVLTYASGEASPDEYVLTGYDEERLLTYIRLLDAAADDADWREVAKIV
ncbi:hypothetical protein EN788_54270, partial [Mesorhizobium sp. M2D.F.Ca.ET.145.01.1.1]